MLRPSRPMIRPFISSLGRWTTVTVCSAVWSAATRWIAVTTTSRARSSASSRALPLDRLGELDRVVLGLLADGLEEDRLGLLGGHAADSLEGGDLLLVGPGRAPRGLARARARGRSACGRAARACPPAGRAARRAGGAGARGSTSSPRLARASSSASRWRRIFSSFASRIRSFCWARASPTMRAAFSSASFIAWLAHWLRATKPRPMPTARPTSATRARATEFHLHPPIRPGQVGRVVCTGSEGLAGPPKPPVAYYYGPGRPAARARTLRLHGDRRERHANDSGPRAARGRDGRGRGRARRPRHERAAVGGRPEHVVLDRRSTPGGGWQDRWDAFRLVSPNWMVGVPGLDYEGTDPDGYMGRDELIAHFRRYASVIAAPVELDTDVLRLSPISGRSARFRLATSRGTIDTRNVIVAGGPFQTPHIPAMADGFAPPIRQLHAHQYRRPDDLAPGKILLVGSGQTGVQLAEELRDAGREVILAVGRCGRAPRRYRGRDLFWWLRQIAVHGHEYGVRLVSVGDLPSPAARFMCNVRTLRPRRGSRGEPPPHGDPGRSPRWPPAERRWHGRAIRDGSHRHPAHVGWGLRCALPALDR